MKLELNKVYRARNGTEWKIILQPIVRSDGNFMGINKDQDYFNFFTKEGLHRDIINKEEYNLIELVGDEFIEDEAQRSKKLREFKFIGYIYENEETSDLVETFSIPNKLGHDSSAFYIASNPFGLEGKIIYSKWEVTMKELPND